MNASNIVAVSRKTGERWVKEYNAKGIEGLLHEILIEFTYFLTV